MPFAVCTQESAYRPDGPWCWPTHTNSQLPSRSCEGIYPARSPLLSGHVMWSSSTTI